MSPDAATPDPQAFLPLRAHELAALMILEQGPLHAWGIAQRSEERGTVRLEIGSLYRMLARLLGAGLIDETERAGAEKAGPGGIRRIYAITELGRAVAAAEVRRLASVVEAARRQQLLEEGS